MLISVIMLDLSFSQSLIIAFIFWPMIHVLASQQVKGGKRAGWFILVLLFSWVGYAVFLIVNSTSRT